MSTIAIMLASIVLATAGQVLLRAGMSRVGEVTAVIASRGVVHAITAVATTWQVVVGLGSFGLSAVFWLVALSRVPLSTAYPVVSLSYVLILVFSVIVLGERPAVTVWVGAFLIMIGIAMVGIGQR